MRRNKNSFNQLFVQVKLVRDKNRVDRIVKSPAEAIQEVKLMLADMDREFFAGIYLSARNSVNCIQNISIGTANASIVSPREVFKTAFLTNSISLIVLHNHPSSDVTPSDDDIKLTKRLDEAGKLLDVELLDHIIIGSNGAHFSMKTRGLL